MNGVTSGPRYVVHDAFVVTVGCLVREQRQSNLALLQCLDHQPSPKEGMDTTTTDLFGDSLPYSSASLNNPE